MSAGLPGLGLGGLFFILTALLAPAVELVRTARGQSSVEAWRGVGRQFTIALVMIVAVELTIRGALLAISVWGSGEGATGHGLTVLPLAPLGITAILLAAVLAGAKALELCLRLRKRGLPRPSISPASLLGQRFVPGAGVLAVARLAIAARPNRERVRSNLRKTRARQR